MIEIRPSECPTTGRDAFDLTLEGLNTVIHRPGWVLRTTLFPFVAIWGMTDMASALPFFPPVETVWSIIGRWTLELMLLLPCLLAWCRIGYIPAEEACRPNVIELMGLRKAVDFVLVVMAVILFLAGNMAFGLNRLIGADSGVSEYWLAVMALGIVGVPALALGGARMLMPVAAAAIGWNLSYRQALVLTRNRVGWLAVLGLSFTCLFPVLLQSLRSLEEIAGGDGMLGIPGVWDGIYFGAMMVLIAVVGHAMGQILRRLVEHIPPAQVTSPGS